MGAEGFISLEATSGAVGVLSGKTLVLLPPHGELLMDTDLVVVGLWGFQTPLPPSPVVTGLLAQAHSGGGLDAFPPRLPVKDWTAGECPELTVLILYDKHV